MKQAVLLLAHGSPETLDGIPEFLRSVTGGRGVPEHVVEEVRRRYELIGGSPLQRLTFAQAKALEEKIGMPVYVGMRNWKPSIPDVVKQMVADGVTQATALCMAPQKSRTSTGLYKEALFEGVGALFPVDFVESWHDEPLLIEAFAEKLLAAWDRSAPILFTAHSVPTRTVQEGDPYEQQARETARLVAEKANLKSEQWRFAFQSQGMSGGPWLGPTVEETIDKLKQQGHRGVFLQPIGFVCDHVEILYDIDVAFRQYAAERGMKLWRAESLNDSPTFIGALAQVVRSRVAAEAKA